MATTSRFSLKQLSRIFVQFRPEDRSAREFLSRIICQRGTNPECKIEQALTVEPGAEPVIEIEFDTKEVVRVDPSGMTVGEILRVVEGRAMEMETASMLKKAGLDGVRWETELGGGQDGWGGRWERVERGK